MNKQMMLLHAKFPDDFATLEMLKLSDIPCICKIGKGGFRVDFLDPLPVVEGRKRQTLLDALKDLDEQD